jgi:hypothetical protein
VAAGFTEAVLPKAKCESWWAIAYDKNRWPHMNGAHVVRAHHTSTPELALTKVLWQRQRAKNLSSFVMLCQVPKTWLGSPALGLGQLCEPRLRPAAASWPSGLVHVDSSEGS